MASSSQMFKQEKSEVEIVQIPFVPSQVDIADLKVLLVEESGGEKIKKYVIQQKTPPSSHGSSRKSSFSLSPSSSLTETPVVTPEALAKALQKKEIDVSPTISETSSQGSSQSGSQNPSPDSSENTTPTATTPTATTPTATSPTTSPTFLRKSQAAHKSIKTVKIGSFRIDSKENINYKGEQGNKSEQETPQIPTGEHISKKQLNVEFKIILFGEGEDAEEYAIYHGKSKNKMVGAGKFGSLKIAQNTKTGEWYVLKVQKISSIIPSEDIKIKSQEWEILKELGLTTTGEISVKSKSAKSSMEKTESTDQDSEDELQHYILMKIAPGFSMEELLKSEEELSPSPDIIATIMHPMQRLKFALKTIEAAQFLYNKKIVHRDIKPANIVLSPEKNSLELVDLGSAKKFNLEGAYVGEKKGTPLYSAPEIKQKPNEAKDIKYDESTEIYSVGLTLIKLFRLTDSDNFEALELSENELEKILGESENKKAESKKEKETKEEEIEEEVMDNIFSTEDDGFIFNTTMNDSDSDHLILKQIQQALIKMTDEDPQNRGGFEDAKQMFSEIIKSYKQNIKMDCNVGLIDVNEYMNSNPEERKNIVKDIVKNLTNKNQIYHQVFFVDSLNRDPIEYIKLKRELEKELRLSFRPQIKNQLSKLMKELINEKIENLIEDQNDPNAKGKIKLLKEKLKDLPSLVEPMIDKLKIPANKVQIMNSLFITQSAVEKEKTTQEIKKLLDKDFNYNFNFINPSTKYVVEGPSR